MPDNKIPGRWTAFDRKPDEAYLGLVDEAMGRIEAGTSPYARAAVHTLGPYNPDQAPPQHYSPDLLSRESSLQKEADFEDIEDDYEYKLAQELYYREPEESVQIGREIFGLFPGDLAVVRIEARRSVDLVNIETFRSERGLYDYWNEVLDTAEY